MPTKRGCATSRPVPLHPAFRPVLIIPLHHHRKMATVVLKSFPVQNHLQPRMNQKLEALSTYLGRTIQFIWDRPCWGCCWQKTASIISGYTHASTGHSFCLAFSIPWTQERGIQLAPVSLAYIPTSCWQQSVYHPRIERQML